MSAPSLQTEASGAPAQGAPTAAVLLTRAERGFELAEEQLARADAESPEAWLAQSLLREVAWLAALVLTAGERADAAALLQRRGEQAALPVCFDALNEPPRQQVLSNALSPASLAALEGIVAALLAEARASIRGNTRRARALLFWLAALALIAAGTGWFSWRPFDLARGRAFRASSSEPPHPLTGKVTISSPGHPFVQTRVESSPWLEIDLGSVRGISSVDVRNRSDCCGERALPLLIEVRSDELEPWALEARRDRPFLAWTADMPGTRARYVRLRVPRVTSLQLEGVSVR